MDTSRGKLSHAALLLAAAGWMLTAAVGPAFSESPQNRPKLLSDDELAAAGIVGSPDLPQTLNGSSWTGKLSPPPGADAPRPPRRLPPAGRGRECRRI